MNKPVPFLAFILAALVSLGACGRDPGPGPLAGAAIGVPFALTDQNGKTVKDTDFTGRYRIVYFGYTFCPDVCPTDAQAIGAGLKAFEAKQPSLGAKVVPIFITVDPERDTPAVLKSFTAAFHPRFVGLTGTPQQISGVAKGYGIYFHKEPPAPGGGYMVTHSDQAYLMDPAGKPIALLPTDKGADGVAAELETWVR